MGIQGYSVDSPLTREGIKQIKIVGQEFKNIKFDAVYSSDILRAQKTAEIINQEHKLIIKTSELLRERKYGKFEGKSTLFLEEFNKLYDKLTDEERFHHRIDENAESDEESVSRFITFIREAALAHLGKNILVATHGGIMRIFLLHIGFLSDKYFSSARIPNASYVKLLSDGVEFFVEETKGIKRPE